MSTVIETNGIETDENEVAAVPFQDNWIGPDDDTVAIDDATESNGELSATANEVQQGQAEAEIETTGQVEPGEIADAERAALLEEIFAAEIACREKESIVEELKEELKAAKADLELAVSKLRNLARHVHDKPSPLFDQPRQAATKGNETTEGSGDSELWRDEPINGIFDGIKGLGKKKLETMLELCPTAGKFEDLRGEASRAHKQFREVLPKGFGQGTADEMEERFLNWLQRYQVASVPVEPAEPSGDVAPFLIDSIGAAGVELQNQLDTRANELGDSDLSSQHPDGCKYHMEGNETEFLYSCPYPAGEERDDWIRGWLSAVNDGGEIEPDSDVEESTAATVDADAELAEL